MPNHFLKIQMAYICRFSILCKISCQHLQVCPSNRISTDQLKLLERRQWVNFSYKYLTVDQRFSAKGHPDSGCLKLTPKYPQQIHPSRGHTAQQSDREDNSVNRIVLESHLESV